VLFLSVNNYSNSIILTSNKHDHKTPDVEAAIVLGIFKITDLQNVTPVPTFKKKLFVFTRL